MFLLDKGASLGKVITKFRHQYCYRGGFKGKEWIFRQDRKELLEATIAGTTFRVDALEHLDLPPVLYPTHRCEINPDARRVYQEMERSLFSLLADDESIYVGSASAAYGACKQIANGRVYANPEDQQEVNRDVRTIHTSKVELLDSLLEETLGQPGIIAFQFKHDLEALRTLPALKDAPAISGGTDATEAAESIKRWNERKINYLLVQPQSVSHGVNLQAGGNELFWFGLTDRLEEYLQLNRRLWRQGVEGQVRIHHLITADTVEEVVLQRLLDKDENQKTFLERLKDYAKR